MITVYGMSTSGNCYKIRLLLEQLGREYSWIEIDSANGQTRTPEYLARNPNGRVPMLELDDGRLLVESNAILCYLAEGSAYLPADHWRRAQALSWMFFEQYSHEPHIAIARLIRGWLPPDSPRRSELPRLLERGNQALAVMEKYLQDSQWFSGPVYGVADIALFAYTDRAAEGGFDVAAFPLVSRWLARVRGTPGFLPMPDVSIEVAARLASENE